VHRFGTHAALSCGHRHCYLRGRDAGRVGRQAARVVAHACGPEHERAAAERNQGTGLAHLYRSRGRVSGARVSGQPRDLFPGALWRTCRTSAAHRRHAAACTCAREPEVASSTGAADPGLFESLGDRRAVWPARRARLLHRGRHRNLLCHRLGGALQLQSHRRALDRTQAQVGACRWRRGRIASVQHPRQCLCHRRHRFHRRYADHPRTGRSQPRRVCLSSGDRRHRTVEDRSIAPRRQRALSAGDAELGNGDGVFRRASASHTADAAPSASRAAFES